MTLSKLFVESYQLSFAANMVLIKHAPDRKARPLKIWTKRQFPGRFLSIASTERSTNQSPVFLTLVVAV